MSDNYNLTELALNLVAPGNKVLYDENGLPSIMVEIPKMKMSELITGGSDDYHPAFIVNGVVRDSIFISKYVNIVNNGVAQSLPGVAPKKDITFNNAIQACAAKGAGWHLMTAAEHALIALICHKSGFFPWGCNDTTKDYRETEPSGIPIPYTGGTYRNIYTGTGSEKYSHTGDASGIYDLNGNAELIGGQRMVNGEIQLIPDNDAADSSISQAYDSAAWKAINATTGEFIAPNGSGTTESSIKSNRYLDGNIYQIMWSTQAYTSQTPGKFKKIQCDSNISDAAKTTLYAYLLAPQDSNWEDDFVMEGNGLSEGIYFTAGAYDSQASAGVAFRRLRSRNMSSGLCFRCAYINLSS